jgi:hypothetical protein
MRRVAAKTPVATSTRPSIAAAPIPKSAHAKPEPATTAGATGFVLAVEPPRPYFRLSASLRSISARYSAGLIDGGLPAHLPSPYFSFSASLRSMRARYSAFVMPAGRELAACTDPAKNARAATAVSRAATR